ncbi:MAG: helix-turn-helix domain-containing protein [bacterium]
MDNTVRKNLGELIRKIREEKGWSQRKLSLASNISNTTISRIEKGETKSPDVDTLKKIAIHLNTSYDELMASAGYIQEPINTIPELPDNLPFKPTARDKKQYKDYMLKAGENFFYNDEYSEDDKQEFMEALMRAFIRSKEESKKRFTPKSKKKNSE